MCVKELFLGVHIPVVICTSKSVSALRVMEMSCGSSPQKGGHFWYSLSVSKDTLDIKRQKIHVTNIIYIYKLAVISLCYMSELFFFKEKTMRDYS